MTLTLAADPLPLVEDQAGTVRVGGTRVSLEVLVSAFRVGRTPESIIQGFPSLALADVHAVLAFYLRHRAEVDAYMAEQERRAEEIRREVEARWPPDGLWERLEARRSHSKS